MAYEKKQAEQLRDVGAIVARMVGGEDAGATGGRGRELRSLTGALAGSARTAGKASLLGGRWLTDLLIDLAPRLPLRDLSTLRAQHPGLGDHDLAEALISGAAKATAAVGAAGGALAAIEFAAPPALLTAPVQLAAETLLIAAIEVKLIAELHEVHGVTVPGSARERGLAYLAAWTHRRGVNPLEPGGVRFALGAPAKAALRRRLVRRAGRNLSTMGPLMSGAVAGSVINHRETRRVGGQVRDDLRRR
ncbi:MAG: hypothetical protein ACXV4A_03095 [Actinomycetes bacterium]